MLLTEEEALPGRFSLPEVGNGTATAMGGLSRSLAPALACPYTPRHLAPEQWRDLYAQALSQAEVAVCNAWLNHLAAPHDPVRIAAYTYAAAAQGRLETDLARLGGED